MPDHKPLSKAEPKTAHVKWNQQNIDTLCRLRIQGMPYKEIKEVRRNSSSPYTICPIHLTLNASFSVISLKRLSPPCKEGWYWSRVELQRCSNSSKSQRQSNGLQLRMRTNYWQRARPLSPMELGETMQNSSLDLPSVLHRGMA